MSNTQIPTTRLDILRGTLQDIADLIHTIDHPHAMEKAIELCARAEGEATDALDEYKERNPVIYAWLCIVGEPTFTDEILTETPEEAEALNELETKMAALDLPPMTTPEKAFFVADFREQTKRLDALYPAIFDPILDMVRPPKGMSA